MINIYNKVNDNNYCEETNRHKEIIRKLKKEKKKNETKNNKRG